MTFYTRLTLSVEQVVSRLETAGLKVYTHHQVPCNDGGFSPGQAVVANLSKEVYR